MSKLKNKKIKLLKDKLELMKTANEFAPFPVYDTDVVREFEIKLLKIEQDEEEVECCSICKSLYIIDDEDGIWCGKCDDNTRVEFVNNIEEYIKKYGYIWS